MNPDLQFRPIAKVIYTASLSSHDRLVMHQAIVDGLNVESGLPLGVAVQLIFDHLKSRGIVAEAINTAMF